MAKKLKWATGQIIKVGAIVIGIYLITIVFGFEPLIAINKILQEESGWVAFEKSVLQVLKLMFGITYTLFGMVALYRFGNYLVTKSRKDNK